MAIYTVGGTELGECFNTSSESLDYAYDANKNTVFERVKPRTVLFEDDFNGNALNTENWRYEIGNVRSNELQFYRFQNVSVENGNLVITAKRESFSNKDWTSGSITTNFGKAWKYGRFEARIKFPNIVGAFGAFWTLGDGHRITYTDYDGTKYEPPTPRTQSWPECGEIDIVETIPGDASTALGTVWKCTSGILGQGRSPTINLGDYHIYALEWTDSYISILVDDVEYKRLNLASYASDLVAGYHLPQYILIDLAVGRSGGDPAPSTNEMKMYVDWVRVYEPLTN